MVFTLIVRRFGAVPLAKADGHHLRCEGKSILRLKIVPAACRRHQGCQLE
jgi:hypothetical protein